MTIKIKDANRLTPKDIYFLHLEGKIAILPLEEGGEWEFHMVNTHDNYTIAYGNTEEELQDSIEDNL